MGLRYSFYDLVHWYVKESNLSLLKTWLMFMIVIVLGDMYDY